jgi:hypothetical protein
MDKQAQLEKAFAEGFEQKSAELGINKEALSIPQLTALTGALTGGAVGLLRKPKEGESRLLRALKYALVGAGGAALAGIPIDRWYSKKLMQGARLHNPLSRSGNAERSQRLREIGIPETLEAGKTLHVTPAMRASLRGESVDKESQLEQAFVDGFVEKAARLDLSDLGDDLGELAGIIANKYQSAHPVLQAAPVGAGLAGLYGLLAPEPEETVDPRLLRALRYAMVGGLGAGVGTAALDPNLRQMAADKLIQS